MTGLLRRMLVTASVASILVLAGAGARAMAHPLGNFTINHHVGIHLGEAGLRLEYVIDMAEIPAFAEIRTIGSPTDTAALKDYSSRACTTLAKGLRLTLDGAPIALEPRSTSASTPPGNSGVPTLRIECTYWASVGSGRLLIEDANHSDRIGWREMVATSEVIPISTDLPAESPSSKLTAYPANSLSSAPDIRIAEIVVGQGVTSTPEESTPAVVAALGSVVQIESLGLGTGLAAIVAALALGTGHALAPGHGKTVVAAFLIGSRGTGRQAVGLALATAFSHTVGVAILGVVAASAAVTFEPTVVYPYLSGIAGLVVLGIGVRLMRRLHAERIHEHDHDHDHPHHTVALSWKSVAALGLSGGLVPSASAVVLLLGAIHIGRAWFGVLLVVAFGIGMSVALVGSGVLAVLAQRLGWQLIGRRREMSPLRRWIPRLGAGVVLTLGTIMTFSAVADISILG